jgi:hypothetical protein
VWCVVERAALDYLTRRLKYKFAIETQMAFTLAKAIVLAALSFAILCNYSQGFIRNEQGDGNLYFPTFCRTNA